MVKWPGLNMPVTERFSMNRIEVIGEDVNREKRLTDMRNTMDKFRKISVAPHERGFTGSSMNGKRIGPPTEYDEGLAS